MGRRGATDRVVAAVGSLVHRVCSQFCGKNYFPFRDRVLSMMPSPLSPSTRSMTLTTSQSPRHLGNMLEHIPTELQLKTLAYLELRDLHNARLISRSWNVLFSIHQTAIYRNAAYVHGLIPNPEISLEDTMQACPRGSNIGVTDWKSFGTLVWI